MAIINGTNGPDNLDPYDLDFNFSNIRDTDIIFNGFDGNDTINGGSGNNTINGGLGDDSLIGGFRFGNNNNRIDGGAGNDTINSGSGDNTINGGLGNDQIDGSGNIDGGAGNDTINGDNGNDSLLGGDGNDSLLGGLGNDTINGGSGNDTISGDFGNLGNGVILTVNGNTISGDYSDNFSSGSFSTYSNDLNVVTDILTDVLTGGSGNDVFDFNSVFKTQPGLSRRVITDFVGNGNLPGDQIDLSTIDANSTLGGNQAFSFIGAGAFSAPGQIRYSGGILQGNTDQNLSADFEIRLAGTPQLVASDIIL